MGAQTSTDNNKPRAKYLEPTNKGESRIVRSVHLDNELFGLEKFKVGSLHEVLMNSVDKAPKNNFLGTKKGDNYEWLSYGDVAKKVRAIGSGLLELGLVPHESKLGLMSINRLEWNLTEYSANAYSLCLVPLYDTLGREGVIHIINECELSVVVSSPERVSLLLKYASETKSLKTIITMGSIDEKEQTKAKEEFGIEILTFQSVEERGKEKLKEFAPPKPDELATICYTSGTTGLPKGVLLTHANFVLATYGLTYGEVTIDDKDIHISYLPSAHVFERVIATIIMANAASMGYYSGDAKKLFDDILVLKPTIFVTVPRLLGRLYDKVMEAVTVGGITEFTFKQALDSKMEGLKQGQLTHSVWDTLVFSKIKAKLGGNVRFIITGSAPISPNLVDFLRVCFCCPVLEGYGQTETACGGTRTLLWDVDAGHVGVPLPVVEIKLVDVPEMNYFSTDNPPRGEICFRGPTCTSGYYKNPEKTKELIDEDGWLHSGDVGLIFPNGNIKIIDRVKNIFKLSIGEYIAPEKIEQVFQQSKWVAQAFIYGDSLKASLVGIIVPDKEVLVKWAEDSNHADKADYEALCKDPAILKMINDDITGVGKKCELKPFEFPRKIMLSTLPFSVENDMLTPTFKLKRHQAKQHFLKEIEELYVGLE